MFGWYIDDLRVLGRLGEVDSGVLKIACCPDDHPGVLGLSDNGFLVPFGLTRTDFLVGLTRTDFLVRVVGLTRTDFLVARLGVVFLPGIITGPTKDV